MILNQRSTNGQPPEPVKGPRVSLMTNQFRRSKSQSDKENNVDDNRNSQDNGKKIRMSKSTDEEFKTRQTVPT